MSRSILRVLPLLVLGLVSIGCASPYYADRGALLGGLGGAGVGAIVGDAVGNAGAGAAIGAGVGALSGAAIGSGMDEIEARNRAEIEARIGRPVAPGGVTFQDAIAMTRSGVEDDLIVNHIRANGVARSPQTGDLIALKQAGVSARVIEAMQAPPPTPMVVREAAPPPVIVEEHYYEPPYYRPYCYRPHRHRHYPPPPRFGWGFSYHSGHH